MEFDPEDESEVEIEKITPQDNGDLKVTLVVPKENRRIQRLVLDAFFKNWISPLNVKITSSKAFRGKNGPNNKNS